MHKLYDGKSYRIVSSFLVKIAKKKKKKRENTALDLEGQFSWCKKEKMAVITKNRQKSLIFIMVLNHRKQLNVISATDERKW